VRELCGEQGVQLQEREVDALVAREGELFR
jgi:hypothetical protein